MTVDSKSVWVAPLADLRVTAEPLGVGATAELPRGVVDVLRQRGVVGGPVLLLTGCAPDGGGYEAAPQFQLARGAIHEASALASRGGFAAVVLTLGGSRAGEFQSTLTAIAPQLAPGTLLVVLALAVAMSIKTGVATARLRPIPIKKHGRKAWSLFALGLHGLRKIFAVAKTDQIIAFLKQLLSPKLPLKSLQNMPF